MSAWMWMPYFDHQVELGKMTREEADKEIWHMIEIDNMPEYIVREEPSDKSNDIIFERRYLGKWNISEPIKDNFGSDACLNCPSNPKNGGDGICCCTLGQMEIR